MNITQEALRAYTDGYAGPLLVASQRLPDSLASGWNSDVVPTGAIDVHNQLLLSMVHASPPSAMPLPAMYDPSTARADFLDLNAKAVRHSPTFRAWSPDEGLQVRQRLHFGCSAMIIRILRHDGSRSDPLLCFSGPLAAPLDGQAVSKHDLFSTPVDAHAPLGDIVHHLPASIAPVMLATSANSRQWILQHPLTTTLAMVKSQGGLLTVLDPTVLHDSIAIQDLSGVLSKLAARDPILQRSGVWAPIPTSGPQPPSAVVRAFFSDLTESTEIPPDPLHPLLWTKPPSAWTPRTIEHYRPLPDNDRVIISSSSGRGRRHTGDYLMIPRALLFPTTVDSPVGLLLDHKNMSFQQLQCLVAHICHADKLDDVVWLDNAIFRAWYAATRLDPDKFAVTAIPYDLLSEAFPSPRPPFAFDLFTHLECSIHSQFWWDAVFSSHTDDRPSFTGLLQHATELVTQVSTFATSAVRKAPWGPIASVFKHPFIPLLLPAGRQQWKKSCRWSEWASLPKSSLPSYIHPFLDDNPPSSDPPHGSYQLIDDGSEKDNSDNSTATSSNDDDDGFITFTKTRRQRPQASPPPAAKRAATSLSSNSTTPTAVHPTNKSSRGFDPMKPASISPTPNNVDTWILPFRFPFQSSLPVAVRGQADTPLQLGVAIHLFSEYPDTVPDKERDKPIYAFSRELMSRTGCPTQDAVRLAAFLGAFRLPEPECVQLHTVDLPGDDFWTSDYLHCPGFFGSKLAHLMTTACNKNPNSPHVQKLQQWFSTNLHQASAEAPSGTPTCNFHPDFITASVVTAVMNFDVIPGRDHLSENDIKYTGSITPWFFLPSLATRPTGDSMRVPPCGLTAQEALDYLQNTVFFFHLLFRDSALADWVGPHHSPFSRWSPFCGCLMALSSPFCERNFSIAWDTLPLHARLEWTKALLQAVSSLFRIFTKWASDHHSPSSTFFLARYREHTNLVLLNPITEDPRRILDDIRDWHQDILVFSLNALRCAVPSHGFFAIPTPDIFLPASSESVPHSVNTNQYPLSRAASVSGAVSQPYSALPPRAASKRPSHQPEGESRPDSKAKLPLICSVGPAPPKAVAEILRDYNQNRGPGAPRLSVPYYWLKSPNQHLQICFKFATDSNPGCMNPRCKYVHLDAHATTQTAVVPPTYFAHLVDFLNRPELQVHYQPSPHLLALLPKSTPN